MGTQIGALSGQALGMGDIVGVHARDELAVRVLESAVEGRHEATPFTA